MDRQTRWRRLAISPTLQHMDTAHLDTGKTPRSETEAHRQNRIAWEAERIAEARADVAAGRLVSSAKVKAWLDSIGSDHKLPVPFSAN
jgi:hypothetical protein